MNCLVFPKKGSNIGSILGHEGWGVTQVIRGKCDNHGRLLTQRSDQVYGPGCLESQRIQSVTMCGQGLPAQS